MPSVLLTRPSNRAGEQQPINRLLSEAGVQVLELPMLRFGLPRDLETLDAALKRMASGGYDYAILTSPTAVDFFQERVEELGLPREAVQRTKFGTVGAATEERLRELGYHTALPVPHVAGWQNFVRALDPLVIQGKRVLLLQSQIGLEELDHAFQQMGAETERVVLYITKGPSLGDAARLLNLFESQERPDVVAFFSPSSVAFFVTALAEMASGMLRNLPAIACIGETTAREVEERLRRRPEIVARKADQESLAKDILIYLDSKNLRLN
jgi:uroporphyrinogen-III synthase